MFTPFTPYFGVLIDNSRSGGVNHDVGQAAHSGGAIGFFLSQPSHAAAGMHRRVGTPSSHNSALPSETQGGPNMPQQDPHRFTGVRADPLETPSGTFGCVGVRERATIRDGGLSTKSCGLNSSVVMFQVPHGGSTHTSSRPAGMIDAGQVRYCVHVCHRRSLCDRYNVRTFGATPQRGNQKHRGSEQDRCARRR